MHVSWKSFADGQKTAIFLQYNIQLLASYVRTYDIQCYTGLPYQEIDISAENCHAEKKGGDG